jgi:hypothetical protein
MILLSVRGPEETFFHSSTIQVLSAHDSGNLAPKTLPDLTLLRLILQLKTDSLIIIMKNAYWRPKKQQNRPASGEAGR